MSVMREYRVYLIERDDGSFVEGIDLTAADDVAAIAAAQQRADRHDIKLWHGARWMAQIKGR